MCGEKDTWSFSSSPRTGSPPRVRGKVITYQLTPERSGITPACAGKRNSQHTTFTSERDHPRVCGEKGGPHRAGHPPRGSPPRVRGKAEWENLIGSDVRITPACAGKREQRGSNSQWLKDHPRVCGEKVLLRLKHSRKLGSPPRVRGKVDRTTRHLSAGGITPACAGKSSCRPCLPEQQRDHPRVCGEKNGENGLTFHQMGSPPRVRGKAIQQRPDYSDHGITPACAGKRLKRSHSIGHFSCILCLFHSVLHRASVSGGSRAGPCAPPCLPAQNAVPV